METEEWWETWLSCFCYLLHIYFSGLFLFQLFISHYISFSLWLPFFVNDNEIDEIVHDIYFMDVVFVFFVFYPLTAVMLNVICVAGLSFFYFSFTVIVMFSLFIEILYIFAYFVLFGFSVFIFTVRMISYCTHMWYWQMHVIFLWLFGLVLQRTNTDL